MVQGTFVEGLPNGLCRFETPLHNIYYGYMKEGFFQGKGLTYFSDNDTWQFSVFNSGEEFQILSFGRGKPKNFSKIRRNFPPVTFFLLKDLEALDMDSLKLVFEPPKGHHLQESSEIDPRKENLVATIFANGDK